jgi:ATP phosphoribosyltransferase
MSLYNMLIANGYTIIYGPSSGTGSNGSHLYENKKTLEIYWNAKDPADIAGIIAHEAMHLGVKGSSLLEEYNAMFVGDSVRNCTAPPNLNSSAKNLSLNLE